MIIGVPKEVKIRESRVACVPGGVEQFVKNGHKVLIEAGAGLGAGIADADYVKVGASIESVERIWSESEMIIKVKEPIEEEYARMQEGQILYTFLHLAAVPKLTHELLERKVIGLAYETIEQVDRSLPLLKPMSEVAGKMAVQVGIRCLEKQFGGKGLLLGGVPGVRRGKVTIIGGGYVGINAAKVAIGMGALVTVVDINQSRCAYLDDVFGNQITTLMSNPENIARCVEESDLVIGAVLVTGAKAPTLVTREMVKRMEAGSAIVDVAIDQGGSVETIRPTTHDDPIYCEDGVIHYGVTNMPGSVSKTSTYALTNVTTPYALQIANLGIREALQRFPELELGINTYGGSLTCKAVAEALELPYDASCPWKKGR
ncbi:MAG: alanine dehydrogenase [Zetaproteobacteria bacterium]|nr:alanine dehydrogenase [Zetaproteobacteria bacterium]